MFVQLEIETRTKVDFVDITTEVQKAISAKGTHEGICFIFCPHTTAGIVLNENWDPTVRSDIAMVLEHMVPTNLPYRHSEGNSDGHAKAILAGSDHFIFIHENRLQLGTWQGIYLAEFDGPRRRKVWVKVQPNCKCE